MQKKNKKNTKHPFPIILNDYVTPNDYREVNKIIVDYRILFPFLLTLTDLF